MTFVLAALAALALAWFLIRSRSKRAEPEAERETNPALEAWILDTLETELAEGALGLVGSTTEERAKIAQSLRGNPDPDVVSTIEDKVRAVEIEYTRYVHETDAEVTIRVRYDDGKAATASKRLAWASVPAAVRDDFERKKTSRVFRTWTFPWSRARAL
jgi:hypothetical protein